MHDCTLPLPTRLDAAAKLGDAELHPPPPVRCTIHIDTMFLSPGTVVSRADMLYLQWCYEHPAGPMDPNDPITRQIWCRASGFPDPVIPTPGNLADLPTEGNA
jgi:hypothetical protein